MNSEGVPVESRVHTARGVIHGMLSNLQDERITRTVARSFAPEFSYHMDFPCPLLWTEVDCDALSLAEILETAEATFEVWHQVPSSMFGRPHLLLSDHLQKLHNLQKIFYMKYNTSPVNGNARTKVLDWYL